MHTLVTGATGFIGREIVGQLGGVSVLSRDPRRARQVLGDVPAFAWDWRQGSAPREAFDGVEAIIHLAGEPVADGRWSAAKKARIRDSRVVATRRLVDTLEGLQQRPRVLVSASAIGYYGPRGDEVLTETSPPGNDFLADVCRGWEAEAQRAGSLGMRVVCLRIGIVLAPGGGALAKMLPLFKLGLGGRLGSGRQWMSWVHRDDVVALALWAAREESIRGPVNCVAPQPLTNREFTRVMGSVLRRPVILPAPAFGLRLAVGEFAEILLMSQRVEPRVASQGGYPFRFESLRPALESCV